ncbi:unnamed protein product [Adineta steineri]|uniref:Archaemetzincin-2 n=1 Tax=Adineta steineri TaxID=433720 RepID=A0A818ZT33_9BILA|nr:unnamed protein product [Adineta steineri]CAF3773300.1 unnamed protein product [Adineta steineri]
MSFTASSNEQIADALGDISQLPKTMKMAVTKEIEESFQPVPRPNGGDWLAQHNERGQTMESFQQTSSKAIPHGTHKTIYIQPIGSFNHPRAAPLDVIIKFVRIFFSGCEVELLPTVDFTKDMRKRDLGGQPQYLTGDFHNYLVQTRPQRDPRRELLCVAVTMADIYPGEGWNFVYGEARPKDGVGVYSFARLDPLFYRADFEEILRTSLTEEHRILMFRRCIKVLLHEIGHLFGLNHCIYYVCLMNGANNEKEMDRQPLYLCPICLCKLHSTLQFDVQHLYETFADQCDKHGLEAECSWYQKRLEYIDQIERC